MNLHGGLRAYKIVRTSPRHIAVIPCPRNIQPARIKLHLGFHCRLQKMGARKMILITGANRSIGKAILQKAIQKATKVLTMYRSKEKAAKTPAECEAVLADYADRQSLLKAL